MNDPVEKRNSIMKKLSDLMFHFLWRFLMFFRRSILKSGAKQQGVILFKAYIKANSLFPESTLDENQKLASLVVSNFFNLEIDITVKEEKKEHVKCLQDELLSDENVENDIANYFLIDAFSYSYMNKLVATKFYIENTNEALAKARSYKKSAEPISYKDLSCIEKKTRRKIKALKKQIKKINTKKIEEEKSKLIGTIKITQSHILFFASVFSSLFLVGGFLYTRFLLLFLGINTSDFFDIYDYLSSSVDIIFSVFISTVAGMFFYFMGISDDLSRIISEGQLNLKTKNKTHWLKFITLSLAVVFCVQYYYHEIFEPYLLFPFFFFSLYHIIFDFIKLDKYIENKIAFGPAVISIFGFILYLAVELSDILYEVKNGNYQSQYVVSFAEGYEVYSEHKFFMANSKYAFLLNDDTQEIAVIPITGIKSMQTKKSP